MNAIHRARLALVAGVVVLSGCSALTGPDERLELEVFESRVACTGVGPRECLLVRHAGESEIGLWYSGIAGFTHEIGYRYRIEVSVKRISNPPADGSSREYTLRRVRSRVPSPRMDLLERTLTAEARWADAGPLRYDMVQRLGCFCTEAGIGAVRLDVIAEASPTGRHETVREVRREDTGEVVTVADATRFLSVSHLFRYIHWSIARDADRIDVEFDDQFGYPARVYVDLRSAVSDDEFDYIVESIEGS